MGHLPLLLVEKFARPISSCMRRSVVWMHPIRCINSMAKCLPPHGSIGTIILPLNKKFLAVTPSMTLGAFVRGIVSDIDSERPTFDIEFAPVYNGVLQAERIVEILKFIVAKHVNVST